MSDVTMAKSAERVLMLAYKDAKNADEFQAEVERIMLIAYDVDKEGMTGKEKLEKRLFAITTAIMDCEKVLREINLKKHDSAFIGSLERLLGVFKENLYHRDKELKGE